MTCSPVLRVATQAQLSRLGFPIHADSVPALHTDRITVRSAFPSTLHEIVYRPGTMGSGRSTEDVHMSAFVDFKELKSRVSIEQAMQKLGLTMKLHGAQYRGSCTVCNQGGDRALVITPGKQLFY